LLSTLTCGVFVSPADRWRYSLEADNGSQKENCMEMVKYNAIIALVYVRVCLCFCGRVDPFKQ